MNTRSLVRVWAFNCPGKLVVRENQSPGPNLRENQPPGPNLSLREEARGSFVRREVGKQEQLGTTVVSRVLGPG